MNKLPMTVDGYARLQEEIKRLKSIDRPAVIKQCLESLAAKNQPNEVIIK